MLSKSVVSLTFAASCLMAAPMALAASMDLPPPPAPAPMNQSMGAPAPMDQGMTPGAEQSDLVTNGPQANPGDRGNWSAARNVRESQWYDHLVATNRGFRSSRERKECGPINDAELHSQCMASFGAGAEAHMYGSSRPPHPIRNSSGASE
jgi:hypothetical protein